MDCSFVEVHLITYNDNVSAGIAYVLVALVIILETNLDFKNKKNMFWTVLITGLHDLFFCTWGEAKGSTTSIREMKNKNNCNEKYTLFIQLDILLRNLTV